MINDLGELKKLLALCRKSGVTDIELGTIKIKFGDLPEEKPQELNDVLGDAVGLKEEPGFEGIDPLAFYSVNTMENAQ